MLRMGLGARAALGLGLGVSAGGGAAGNGLLNSLIAYWALDEASGANNALDKHSNGLTLTQQSSPGADTGKVYATARTFDGGADYFSRNSEALLQTGDVDFTFAAWAYITSVSANATLFSKGAEYFLQLRSSFAGYQFFAGPNAAFVANTTLNTWQLFWCWYVAAEDKCYLAINSGAAASASTTATSSTGAFQIGARSGLYFPGRIGPVAFWKRVLSADDRALIYNAGNGLAYASFTT